jgi:hypothetical protein
MIANQKKHKDVKIHKVDNNKFKNIKKFNKYRSSKEILSFANKLALNGSKIPTQRSDICNLVNNISKKYSLKINKNAIKHPKRIHSSKILNILKFNDISTIKRYKMEEEKNHGTHYPSIDVNVKIGRKITDIKNGGKIIKHCKSVYNNKFNKLNIFKEIKNNIQGSVDTKSNYAVKDKKKKIGMKNQIINDENINKQNNEKHINNTKLKFLCCLYP